MPSATEQELLILFLTILCGVALGRLPIKGFTLGTSGVLFVALLVGHLGKTVPANAGMLGLVIFVYCLGIDAGPRFFRMFRQQASLLALVGAAMIVAAMTGTWIFAAIMDLPADLAAGIFAGALTSTPALAAAAETLPPNSNLAVGFGIAYPFGAIGVVMFVQFLSRKLPASVNDESESEATIGPDAKIRREVVEVNNPNIVGRRLSDLTILNESSCQVPRAKTDDSFTPIPGSFRLQLGQHLLLVGTEKAVRQVQEFLGERKNFGEVVLDLERHQRRVVVTSPNIVGKSLKELHLRTKFGVTITQIVRHDLKFVPDAQAVIQPGDALTAIGEPDGLNQFVEFAGHRERSFDETDLISLIAGLLLGVVVGSIEFGINGNSFSLGLAGGPLIVGLILGHFGRIGPLFGHFPRASRFLLTEIGLGMFLAAAGVNAGGSLVPVIREHGLILCVAAVLITAIPLIVGLLLTRYAIHMRLLRSLGAICGAMTSTPGLGALTAKFDSNVPVTSYATVYPMALILMSLLAPVLIALLG